MINPNEYGSLLYDFEEEQNIVNVIKARRIFRYSRTAFDYVTQFESAVCELMRQEVFIWKKYCSCFSPRR